MSGNRFALAYVNLGVLRLHANQDLAGAVERCKKAIEVDKLCETAHVHMAHLCLQQFDLEGAVKAYDDAVALLRMKQELVDCYSMRESAAAQLALLRAQPDVYGPASTRREPNTADAPRARGSLSPLALAVEEHRQRAAAMVAGGQ